MIGALVRKELRELLPWGVLMGALAISEIAVLLVEQIDMLPLGSTFPSLNNAETILYWFAAFAIGTGLVTRERDDGTLGFLDGLPVSRTRVFLVKCAVMLALVLVAPVVRVAAMLAFHAISRESLDAEWHPMLIVQAFGLQMLLIGNGLLVGAALGRLRSLTWFAAGVAAAVLLAVESRMPWTASLNPFSLLDWQPSDAGLRVDRDAILIQSLVAGVAQLIAWRGFVGRARARGVQWTERPLAGAAVTVATIGAFVAVFVIAVPRLARYVAAEGAPGESPAYVFAESPPAQLATRHYRFSYPAHESETALAVAAEADVIFERVHALLGVPLGEPIDVDASGSAPNTHGTAFFGRIRMVLDGDADLVLAHETAHVVAQRAAGGATAVRWAAADVLSEGLASWVDAHYRPSTWTRDDRMLTLAALHSRRELRIEELAAPAVLAVERDEGLKYSAGDALIRAVVRLYGESALPRLLDAFADSRLPSNVGGLDLWQAAFQLAGLDLPAVVDEFYREVSAYAETHAAEIAALPRPRALLVTAGRAYAVFVLVDDGANGILPAGEGLGADLPDFVLRVRPAPDSPLATFTSVDLPATRLYWLSPQQYATGRVCAQPGVKIGSERLLEPWSCTPLGDAAPLDLSAVQQGR